MVYLLLRYLMGSSKGRNLDSASKRSRSGTSMQIFRTVVLGFLLSLALPAMAARSGGGGGGSSLGLGLLVMSPSQDDLNNSIATINSAQSTAIDKLGSAYEFNAYYQYRFQSTMYAMQFRPSYFTQSSKGSGYETKLTGMTFFPMLRIYALENTFIHFFLQLGLGYGKMDGEMTGPGTSVSWSGDAFGTIGGLGAEFCFTTAHCLVVEGNVRYLSIPRNVVKSASGTPAGFSQAQTGQELEANATDVATTFSGIQGVLAYQMNF